MTKLTKRDQEQIERFQQVAAPSTSQVELIKRTVMPEGSTDDELKLALHFAKSRDLDLLAGDVYALKVRDKLTFMTSIDGMRKIAARAGGLRKFQLYWCGEDGDWKDVWLAKEKPAAARCYIRTADGAEYDSVVLMRDYDRGKSLWSVMPAHMLGKVAESHSLRRAFPEALGRIYTGDEMPGESAQEPPQRAIEAEATHGAKPPEREAEHDEEAEKRRLWDWYQEAQDIRRDYGLAPQPKPKSIEHCKALLDEHEAEMTRIGSVND